MLSSSMSILRIKTGKKLDENGYVIIKFKLYGYNALKKSLELINDSIKIGENMAKK